MDQAHATPVAHDPEAAHYLYERYLGPGGRSRLLTPYYRLKPLLPRRLQLALRRAYAPRQAARPFPAWPNERVLLDRRDEIIRNRLRTTGRDRLPVISFWPDGRRFAAILTHDVEGPAGIDNIPRLLEIEQRHGFVSSWNFCGEWYPIPEGVFESLEAAGCEVGLHGIAHDGLLFKDRATFEANLPKIHNYLREWGASGFRAPATHRRTDWMPELGCLYDTSFPDSDPFEPQPGGCCSIFPFLIEDLVELPITLLQDHTLFEILREQCVRLWIEKSDWIIENHGLVNLLVHPDYLLTQARLDLYDEFLGYLARQAGGWHALPREVAQFWKERASLDPETAGDASVAWAYEHDGHIRFELPVSATPSTPPSPLGSSAAM
jgi:peptidoglycan/xylan/chitin deacetylase (PgdA/CDA1 family)